MIRGLIGTGSTVDRVRQGLDASMDRSRTIAHRVANASNGREATFEATLERAEGREGDPVDLETEMVHLADEQLRYDAMSRVLRDLYGQVRSSMRSS